MQLQIAFLFPKLPPAMKEKLKAFSRGEDSVLLSQRRNEHALGGINHELRCDSSHAAHKLPQKDLILSRNPLHVRRCLDSPANHTDIRIALRRARLDPSYPS